MQGSTKILAGVRRGNGATVDKPAVAEDGLLLLCTFYDSFCWQRFLQLCDGSYDEGTLKAWRSL